MILRVSWLDAPLKTVTLYAGIYNLLDKQVIYDGVNYDTVLDGRRYWLGMNVKF